MIDLISTVACSGSIFACFLSRCMYGDIVTMQQFMWQLNIVGVAHFVMDCFDYLDAASSSNQP
jgi:hypothetical protein